MAFSTFEPVIVTRLAATLISTSARPVLPTGWPLTVRFRITVPLPLIRIRVPESTAIRAAVSAEFASVPYFSSPWSVISVSLE